MIRTKEVVSIISAMAMKTLKKFKTLAIANIEVSCKVMHVFI